MKINIPREILDNLNRKKIIEHHHIGGWLYSQSCGNNQFSQFKEAWLRQISLGQSQKEVWEKLIENWPPQIQSPVVIKGMALEMMGLYEQGERFKSDIDILVTSDAQAELSKRLINLGGKEVIEKKWWGNNHKKSFELEYQNNQVVIEMHNLIFYHLPEIKWTDYIHDENKNLLEDHAHLLFMMGHFVFQHNCLKLYWLLDIVLFIQKKSDWDFEHLNALAKKWRLTKSMLWSLKLAKDFSSQHLNIPKSLNIDAAKIKLNLLWEPRQTGFSYWMRKHRTKDNLIDAFKYDLLWWLKNF